MTTDFSNLPEGTEVIFQIKAKGYPNKSKGIIRGLSHIPMLIIGQGYIVELKSEIPNCTYSCVCINQSDILEAETFDDLLEEHNKRVAEDSGIWPEYTGPGR